MAKATIFYSWQSDLSNKTNRTLIQDALEKAARELRKDDSLGVEPVIERDTQGLPGAPDIHTAIFKRIAACDAAVFDLTFVARDKRSHPNPNVLLELGFALGTIGWERVVLVMNSNHGRIEDLPFDLKIKRVLSYAASDDEAPADARNGLAAALKKALEVVLREHPQEDRENQVKAVIAAFHDGIPGAAARLRPELKAMFGEWRAKRPVSAAGQTAAEAVLASFDESAEQVREFTRYVTAVAECRNADGFELVLSSIEELANSQSNRTENGGTRAVDSEFQRLLVRELITLVGAVCLATKNWDLLAMLTTRNFTFEYDHRQINGTFAKMLCDLPVLHAQASKDGTSQVDLVVNKIRERYASGLGGVVIRDLREADYFLYLANELQSAEPRAFQHWFPFFFQSARGSGPNQGRIGWLERCRSVGWLANVARAMGVTNDQFRSRYSERWLSVAALFRAWPPDLEDWLLAPKELGSTA